MATLIGSGAHAADMIADLKTKGIYPICWKHHHDAPDHLSSRIWIGINDPRLRAKVAAELNILDNSWIHRDAHCNTTTIGPGTHVNYAVHAVRTTIGRHCTISPGVTICGDVNIGDEVSVGAGATICDRVTIGNHVTIGAGAVVLPETIIPDGETWVGVPARRV